MGNRAKFELINMIISEGAVEILESASDGGPKQFKDFRGLVNPRTGNKFSPKTILERTKELVKLGALKKVIIRTKRGRDVVGYQISGSGIKALELAKEFERRLGDIFKP
jgi:DNA-binding HxlR family transcriptional regulator